MLPEYDSFITTHFRYSEFLTRATFEAWIQRPCWRVRDFLLYRLCVDHLEPTRAILECPLMITSGARAWADTLRLERQGLHPSKTSDHSFGDDWNPLGVGAADIFKIIDGKPAALTRADHEHVVGVRTETPEDPPWGQLIWYEQLGHMHVANHRDVLYSARAQRDLPFRAYRARTYVKE